MDLVGVLSHHGATNALELAPATRKPVHDADNRLWRRAIGGQLHCRIVVREGEVPDILIYLPVHVSANLVTVAQVASHRGWAERVATVVVAANQDAVGGVQGDEVSATWGNGLGA